MDLRRSVLTKQNNVLCETSLNISSASAYESAADDSNASLYYSFTNDSRDSIGSSVSVQDENDFGNQSTNSDADKENTVIMRKETTPVNSDIEMIHEWEKHSTETVLMRTEGVAVVERQKIQEDEEKMPEIIESHLNSVAAATEKPVKQDAGAKLSLIEEDCEMPDSSKKLSQETIATEVLSKSVDVAVTAKPMELADPIPGMSRYLLSQVESPLDDLPKNALEAVVEIVIEDPNQNIINPFTAHVKWPVLETKATKTQPEKQNTRRSILTTMIPAKATYYSPVLRKSLERKAKANNKPPNARRTLYGEMKLPAPTKPKTPTQIPQPKPSARPDMKPLVAKPILKPVVKPKVYKCPESGCLIEVSTVRALQEHQKQHKAPIVAIPSASNVICKYCDKKFQLENALLNHQADKCSRITFSEKRKLLAQRDKKEKDRRRTGLFTMPLPLPKRKSPARRQSTVQKQHNKSGVMITPKKSLKCHICQAIVSDPLALANHILSHKFGKPANIEQA